ncbi:MAG: hypothetical protein H7X95_05935, partial [Deltaproteobacteria bacterium]|nr:hypothetical protein [Deltaproteobacteria bacterium]
CAGGACHLVAPASDNASGTCLPVPGGGLSLCEKDAHEALLGVPSRQVSPLVLVASRDSSRSYLLRKIIGAPPVVGHSGVPNDNLSQDDKRIIQDWIDRGAPPPPASAPQPGDGGI